MLLLADFTSTTARKNRTAADPVVSASSLSTPTQKVKVVKRNGSITDWSRSMVFVECLPRANIVVDRDRSTENSNTTRAIHLNGDSSDDKDDRPDELSAGVGIPRTPASTTRSTQNVNVMDTMLKGRCHQQRRRTMPTIALNCDERQDEKAYEGGDINRAFNISDRPP
jgi:hypothetical protein